MSGPSELRCDLLIVGGGVGGCAAAMAAASMGSRVILTEESHWLGGQLSSQGVPPDEHPWIENFGCTARYRRYRDLVREYYRAHCWLSNTALKEPHLNPGLGWVSRLCHEPRVAREVLEQMLRPMQEQSGLVILTEHRPLWAEIDGDKVRAVIFQSAWTGDELTVSADFVLDATETGELLPMAGTEYVVGAESQRETCEPHAVSGDPEPENVQGFTWCFAMGYDPDGRHVIEKPDGYERWKALAPDFRPGPLLGWEVSDPITAKPRHWTLFASEGSPGLFEYRRMIAQDILAKPTEEATCVNWPQNDYFLGTILDVADDVRETRLRESRELSLSLLCWLQTEAPRPDGGTGYPGLRLRPDLAGTSDGLFLAPYIRESRRIKAEFTVLEQHVASECNPGKSKADPFDDSVGIGAYRIDLHPSANGRGYIDIGSLPFQIPLGALVPVRMENLLPACKNIGTTHITNGCFRMHPVEWNIGEAAGALAAFCLHRPASPRQVRNDGKHLREFQSALVQQGSELAWPDVHPL